MLRSIIKYGGLALVIIGIVLVMKNLFNVDSGTTNNSKTNKNTTVNISSYKVSISLLDKDTKAFVKGANLVIKDQGGNVVSGWTTEEGVHLVPNLKKGTYTLIQEKEADGYHLNSDGVTFEVKNKDQEIIMYNIKMTEEEKTKYEAEQRAKNTTATETSVDNTLSVKDVGSTLVAILSIIGGTLIILHPKKEM